MKCPKCQTENSQDSRFCKTCATPLPWTAARGSTTGTLQIPINELPTGSTFAGRYQVIEELGHGGMGKVYKVLDTDINEKIALKLLRPEVALDKETIERFSNELKLARKIRHKNICGMFDLGKAEGTTFITMEFVPGEDLKKLIRKMGQIGAGRAVSIAKQVCEGLAEAHRLGIVHRDLKPQNIMVDEDGNVRIMDFGIARSLSAKGMTGTGVMIGTPEYMSPEQVQGKEADQRADIYSLGIILYEMLTGRVPFEADTPFAVAVKHTSEIPQDPRELNAQIPADLDRLILKCLEKDKAKRHQTADELHADLERVEEGLPTTERIVAKRKPLTSRPITVQFDLKRLLKPAFALLAVAAAVFVIWRLVARRPSTLLPADTPSIAVLYFKNDTGDSKFDVWSTALSDSIITDLSQSKYVHVLSTDQLLSILRKLRLLEARSYASEDLRRVADLGHVRHVLMGSMSKAGEAIRINYALQDIQEGKSVTSDRVEGTGENSIFSMVDELTRKVKGKLPLTKKQVASDVDAAVARATTSSPQAYAYFSQAYRFNYQGEYRKCITLAEQAIALDPKFATAYTLLGAAYGNLGYRSKANEFRQKSFELSEQLPDRERYAIQSSYYRQTEVTYDKAIQAFEKRLQIEPNELNAARNLAYIYYSLEDWDKALELAEINIKNDAEAVFPYRYAATAYSAKGLYDKAREVLEDYRRSHADLAYIRRNLVYVFLSQGRPDRAKEEADQAFTLAPSDNANFLVKGDLKCLAGDFSGAEKDYGRLLDVAERSANLDARARLGFLYVGQGKFQKALEEARQGQRLSEELADRARQSYFLRRSAYVHLRTGKLKEALLELDQARDAAIKDGSVNGQVSSLYLKGLALLEANSIAEALTAAEEIRKLVDGWLNPKLMRYNLNLLGSIELKKGNYSRAIEDFSKAATLLEYQRGIDDPHALFDEPMALAYLRLGDLAKAQELYEKITRLTMGRLGYGDIYAKSYFILGKIAEQKGDRARARENYRRFLELWKGSDRGLSEVEDTKKRLSSLGS